MSGVETLNAVFLAAAEFDGTNVTDLETINLGLVHGSDDAAAVASTSNADFNDLKNTTKTVNVHHNQLDVELDYDSGSDTDLTVNGQTDSRSVTFAGTGNNSLNVINVAKVAINNVGDNNLDLTDGVSLDAADTTALSLSTAKQAGNLIVSDDAGVSNTSFDNGNSVESITITALDGDITATEAGDSFMDAAQALQTVDITSTNADLVIGRIGNATAAADLESVTISNTNSASLNIGMINALGANINNVTITTSDKNTVAAAGGTGLVNVLIDGVATTNLDQLTVNANDGGHAAIDSLNGTLDNYTVTGTGNVFITAAATSATAGLTMANTGTSTGYTGTVTINGSAVNDVLRGTASNDMINTGVGADSVTGGAGIDIITANIGAGVGIVTAVDTITLATAQADADFVEAFTVGTDKIQNTVALLNVADTSITNAGNLAPIATVDAAIGVNAIATQYIFSNAAFDLDLTTVTNGGAAATAGSVTGAELTTITTAAMAALNGTATTLLDATFLATETVLFVLTDVSDDSSAIFSFNNSTIGGNSVDAGELVLVGVVQDSVGGAILANGDIII